MPLFNSFITFRSCRHLDGKHTVFGRVVGGLDTLTAMERVETDNKDRPIEDIIVERAQVFVDPYQEADEQLMAERAEEAKKKADEEEMGSNKRQSQGQNERLTVFRSGVGKYINMEASKQSGCSDAIQGSAVKKRKNIGYEFGNFSNW